MEASYVDLADPRHLEFDYVRWMRIVLRAARARRILHIGGGACALARALAAEDPGGRQEVCEVDPEVLAVAREHLGLRRGPGLRVRVAEGRAFVAHQPAAAWDAVAIDAFVAATKAPPSGAADPFMIPRRLITVEALRDAARVAPLTLVNVLDDRSAREVRLVAAGLSEAYPRVWALGGRTGNTIVVGVTRRLGLERIRAQAAADPSPARLRTADAMALMVRGVAPLRDQDLDAV